MKQIVLYAAVLVVAPVLGQSSFDPGTINGQEMRSAISKGVHRGLGRNPAVQKLPPASRDQLETALINQLLERLIIRSHQLEGAIVGSQAIAKDFLKSALKATARRVRQPVENIQEALTVLQQDYRDQTAQLLRSTGLIQLRGQATPFTSGIDLESLINEVLQTLLQDPAFLTLIGYVAAVPQIIHDIADQLFTNKTFGEIFDLLGSGNGQRSVVDDAVADALAHPDFSLAQDVAGVCLQQVKPLLAEIVNRNIQLLEKHVEELLDIVNAFRGVVPSEWLQIAFNMTLKFLFLSE